jgi:DNA-binding SARP family transcriptional activator/tetratricopeptide (TPR) repeat protein
MGPVLLRLLGRPELTTASSREPLEPGQVSQFLAYLAYGGDWLQRDEVVALFWPIGDDASGRRNLRRLLYRARHRLDRHDRSVVPAIDADRQRLRWAVATDVQACREALGRNDFTELFRLWRGPLCEALDSDGDSGFHAWLEVERQRIASIWKHAILAHAERVAGERTEEPAALLAKLLTVDPLDEEVVQALLRVLAQAGKTAELDRAYRAFERRLRVELGIAPAAETRALVAAEVGRPGLLEAPGLRSHEDPLSPVRTAPRLFAPWFVLPFVGRARCLEFLDDRLATARTGVGGAVAVEGEAGIGKTRLVEEFLARATADGVPVFSARCFERELGAPLEPVRTALASILPAAQLEPNVLEWAWSNDRRHRAELHLGLSAELVRMGRSSGVAVLFVDDIQWADAATLEFLSHIAKRVAVEPVLVLVGLRSEDRAALVPWLADLAERRVLHTLRLERLHAPALNEMVAEIGTLARSDAAWLADFVQGETEGNPFYVAEYLRWLVAQGGLLADETARIIDLDRDRITSIELPESVVSLIWARYLGFGSETRNLLDVAAVMGRAFDLSMLEAVVRLPEEHFWASFEPLVTAGLMVEGAEGEYAFSHDKLRQTIYQRLGPPVQRALHERVASVLEGRGVDPADLAHHHLRARNWQPAFLHLMAAATASERNSAWRSALQGYHRAEEIVDRLDDAPRKRFEIWEAKERLLVLMDRRSERAELVERMVSLAGEIGDPRIESRALVRHMAALALAGDRAGVRAARRRAERLLQQVGDASGEAGVFWELTYAAFMLGDDRGVVDAGLEAIRVYRSLGDRKSEAATAWNVALAYRRMDRASDALEWTARAADLYEEIGSGLGAYMRHEMQAWSHRRSGASEAARPLLEKCLELVEAWGAKHLVLEKHMNLGQCLLDLGRLEEAVTHFASAAELGAQLGDPRHEGYPMLQLGTGRQRLGDASGAVDAYRVAARLLGSAYSLTGVRDEQLAQADALTLLGSALADIRSASEQERQAGPMPTAGETAPVDAITDEALGALDQALMIASLHGDTLRASKILMERGTLHWRAARFGPASVDFGAAVEASRHAGATGREIAALASRCVALLDGGRVADGITVGQETLTRLCAFPDRVAEAYVSRSLSRAWDVAGDRVLARAYRSRARRLLSGEGTPADPEMASRAVVRRHDRYRRSVEGQDADVSDP